MGGELGEATSAEGQAGTMAAVYLAELGGADREAGQGMGRWSGVTGIP